MRIGAFTNIAPQRGICSFDGSVFGACIDPMSRLYPHHHCVQFHPAHVDEAIDRVRVEAIVFNVGWHTAYTPAVLEATRHARARGIKVFAFDGDDYAHVFWAAPEGVDRIVDVYRSVDAVLVRHPQMLAAVQALTDRPAVQWYDPLTPLEYFDQRGAAGPRENLIVLPLALGFADQWHCKRLALMNYLVAAALQRRHPEFEVRILKGPRDTIAEKLGLRATFCQCEHTAVTPEVPSRRIPMLDTIRAAKLFIGLDFKAAYGQWIVDAMSAGTPSIHTEFTIAGCLLGGFQTYPFDLDAGVSRGLKLLEDPAAWQRESERALQVAEHFRPSAVRELLEGIIAGLETAP